MKPILLHYYLTNRCNSKCTFCSIWHQSPKTDANVDDVIRNLRDARVAGCKFVDFTGGEPLLYEELPTILSEAKRLGYITSVTTNCLLFEKRVDQLKGKIDLLHFSIDADTAELHDRIRGVKSFSAVMQSIDIALKNKMYPDLLFTYTNENIDSFNGIQKLAKEKHLIAILDPVFNTNGADPLNHSTHAKASEFAKKSGVYLNLAHLKLRESGGNHVRSALCKAVESTIVILPENKLALPCFHHRLLQVDISSNLKTALESLQRTESVEMQGKYSFCEKCHINCYFDPSYTFMRNSFFTLSLISKFRYSYMKYLIYHRPLPTFRFLIFFKYYLFNKLFGKK